MMLDSRWNTNMDARRSISLLIGVAGLAVAALGMAASPVLPAFGGNHGGVIGPVLWAAVGPVFGAATAGYDRHRDSGLERAPLWALAYGATAAVILVATFGMAATIHPTVRGIPGLGDAWYGVIPSGLLVSFVGAFLWKRDAGARRFAALGLLGLFLPVGWVISDHRAVLGRDTGLGDIRPRRVRMPVVADAVLVDWGGRAGLRAGRSLHRGVGRATELQRRRRERERGLAGRRAHWLAS